MQGPGAHTVGIHVYNLNNYTQNNKINKSKKIKSHNKRLDMGINVKNINLQKELNFNKTQSYGMTKRREMMKDFPDKGIHRDNSHPSKRHFQWV